MVAVLLTGFSDGSVVKNLPANAGDIRLIQGNGYPLQYSCLGNPMDSGLQSMVSQSHNLATDTHARTHFIDYLKPLSCFPVPK